MWGVRVCFGVLMFVESECGEIEGGDVGVLQVSGVVEFWQVDDCCGFEDFGFEVLYQVCGCQQGFVGGDEVVEDQYVVVFVEVVGMYFEEGFVVFGLVVFGEYVGGQFVLFVEQDQWFVQCIGYC